MALPLVENPAQDLLIFDGPELQEASQQPITISTIARSGPKMGTGEDRSRAGASSSNAELKRKATFDTDKEVEEYMAASPDGRAKDAAGAKHDAADYGSESGSDDEVGDINDANKKMSDRRREQSVKFKSW